MKTFICKGCLLEFRKIKQRQNRCEICSKKQALKKKLDKTYKDQLHCEGLEWPFEKKGA